MTTDHFADQAILTIDAETLLHSHNAGNPVQLSIKANFSTFRDVNVRIVHDSDTRGSVSITVCLIAGDVIDHQFHIIRQRLPLKQFRWVGLSSNNSTFSKIYLMPGARAFVTQSELKSIHRTIFFLN